MSIQTDTSNLFAPASTAVNPSSASQSARPVTLPHIPELYMPLEQALDALLPRALLPRAPRAPALATVTQPSPFMDALRDVANCTTTWNAAPAYKSTLSPTLDAFASLSQATSRDDIAKLLDQSWAADPAVTLCIVWNLRSIHEGKSAREQFYCAYAWLFAHHPRTAVANLRVLVEATVKHKIKRKGPMEDEEVVLVSADPEHDIEDENALQEVEVGIPHGYWKDLLNILLLATLDQLHSTSDLSALHVSVPRSKKAKIETEERGGVRSARANAEQAKVSRLEKHVEWHKMVVHKLTHNKPYRALYVTVARLFADGLARDLGILRQIADVQTPAMRRVKLSFNLTLVGKWAPSIGGSHDRVTSIATAIAELLAAGGHFPTVLSDSQPLSQEAAHRLRSTYARWVTTPLRRFLQVPEVFMSANQWDQVNYRRVPSHCMRANKAHFRHHDSARFAAYLLAVAQGKMTISGATLLPHELLAEGIRLADKDESGEVINAQWESLVARVRESGTLPNALALCDVSGSMGRMGSVRCPIAPAVALSILISQIAQPPWANSFITFSESPELVNLDPTAGLIKIAQTIGKTNWGYNTDFNAVFTKLILPTAIKHGLRPEDMVKRLFVFSDMQFDNSLQTGKSWASEHQQIKKAFARAGYKMPEIVYWNLAGKVANPVTKNEEGVALVSGFSPGMLKVFLEEGLESEEEVKVGSKDGDVTQAEKKRLDPIDTMLKALGKESYASLEVFD